LRTGGNEQLGNCVTLAFSAADLGPEQFDCRRSPAVERGVEFIRTYLGPGPRHCREVEQAAKVVNLSRSVIYKAARCLGISRPLLRHQNEWKRTVDTAELYAR
jgi:hypothetical protein